VKEPNVTLPLLMVEVVAFESTRLLPEKLRAPVVAWKLNHAFEMLATVAFESVIVLSDIAETLVPLEMPAAAPTVMPTKTLVASRSVTVDAPFEAVPVWVKAWNVA
jgi:hypothetical protein